MGQANETPEALARQRANIVVGNVEPANADKRAGLHPLGGFLVSWAGVSVPELKTNVPLDVQQLVADSGRLVFLMNWETQAARFELALPLDRGAKAVREVTAGQTLASACTRIAIRGEAPALGVRVYRIDY